MTTRIASRPDGPATRGILYVHSAPSALCPHIEWAVGGILGVAVSLDWTPQPAQPGSYRAELSWTGSGGTAAAVASALRGWNHLRFEITEEPTSSTEGTRFSCTPDLGISTRSSSLERSEPSSRRAPCGGQVRSTSGSERNPRSRCHWR